MGAARWRRRHSVMLNIRNLHSRIIIAFLYISAVLELALRIFITFFAWCPWKLQPVRDKWWWGRWHFIFTHFISTRSSFSQVKEGHWRGCRYNWFYHCWPAASEYSDQSCIFSNMDNVQCVMNWINHQPVAAGGIRGIIGVRIFIIHLWLAIVERGCATHSSHCFTGLSQRWS